MECTNAKGYFRGDSEGLVDKLVEASLKRNDAPLPGFGRALEPYFGSSEPAMPVNAGKPASEPTPKPTNNKRKGANMSRSNSGSVSPPATRPPSAGKQRNSKNSTPERRSMEKSAPVQIPRPKAPTVPTVMRTGSDCAFACPAYLSSPKPEALPMPSNLLLRVCCSTAA